MILQLSCDYKYCIRNVMSYDKRFVLSHQYLPKYVRSAQYGCFLQFLYVVLSPYVVQVFLNNFEIVPVNIGINLAYYSYYNYYQYYYHHHHHNYTEWIQFISGDVWPKLRPGLQLTSACLWFFSLMQQYLDYATTLASKSFPTGHSRVT